MNQRNQGAIAFWVGVTLCAYYFGDLLGAGIVIALMGAGMVAESQGLLD